MSEEKTSGTRARKVLVVEDDPGVARVMHIALTSAGFQVTGASSAAEALREMDSEPKDAVILDLTLPDGHGPQVLEMLRKEAGPAWLVTSALDRQLATKRHGSLEGHFVAKPFDPWDLVARLEELLASERGAGPYQR